MKASPAPDVRPVTEIRTGFGHLVGYVVEIPPLFYPVTFNGLHDDEHGWSHSDDTATDAADALRIVREMVEPPHAVNTLVDPGEPTFIEAVLRFLDHLTSTDIEGYTGPTPRRVIERTE